MDHHCDRKKNARFGRLECLIYYFFFHLLFGKHLQGPAGRLVFFLVKNYYFGIILVKISNYLCIFSELYILEETTQHFTGKALRIPTVLQIFYHGLEYLFITEFGLL